ncbi:excinuclease ABC subunit UvrC, partial [Myxococcota bacterium]|nr:excinuclease ABC subunit UvrC [Myxococcota bacterium]
MTPPRFDPDRDIPQLPTTPGVYIMRDAQGVIFYVGKAINLRARLRQYFGGGDARRFVGELDGLLYGLEVLLTTTEKEALLLEATLIHRHQPRHNVLLKTGHHFLYLRLDPRAAWPRLEIVRQRGADEARYFGPFHLASKLREVTRLIERVFPLRTCQDQAMRNRSRPCLQHQIQRCLGPCVLPVDPAVYAALVDEVTLLLEGRSTALIERLEAKMQAAAAAWRYEEAATARDQIEAIRASLERQHVHLSRPIDADAFGVYREGGAVQIICMSLRGGQLNGAEHLHLTAQGAPTPALLSTLINLHYEARPLPAEIWLPEALEDEGGLSEALAERAGRAVRLRVPQRGDAARIMEMAARNAEQAFFQGRVAEEAQAQALEAIQRRLELTTPPRRVECVDISLFQGGEPVGAVVRFEDGAPRKSGYRRYTIKGVEGTDDYAMMREVLTRRLKRGLEEGDLPDLLVVDGGRGQLAVAVAVAQDLQIEGLELAALAKARALKG